MLLPSTAPFTSEVEGNDNSLYTITILTKGLNVKEIIRIHYPSLIIIQLLLIYWR